jgi:hypothetical protein
MPWDFIYSAYKHFIPRSSISIKRWIEILLFVILGMYLVRGCKEPQIEQGTPPTPYQQEESPTPSDPEWDEQITPPPSVEV